MHKCSALKSAFHEFSLGAEPIFSKKPQNVGEFLFFKILRGLNMFQKYMKCCKLKKTTVPKLTLISKDSCNYSSIAKRYLSPTW